MGKLIAWPRLAALAIIAIASVPEARAGEPLKPYVVLALDTSGSMLASTGAGPPSCGGPDTRLNHARCAINNIVNSYGDMVFALGRFRMTMSGTYPSCSQTGAGSSGSATCNGTANMFELLTPLVDGNNELAAVWTDGTYNTCTASGTDPEVWHAHGNTPLAGTLVGAKHYWSGLQAPNHVIWPANLPGFAVWVGLSQTQPGVADSNRLEIGSPQLAWRWVSSAGLTTGAAGTYFVNVYMREDGTSVDGVALARAGTTPPPFGGKTWAYENNRKVAQPQVCNGDDYDTTPGGDDDDDILPTGSLPGCFANGPGTNDAYDMSGNVKEWTAARAPGQNPIRGGASNNETAGLTCELSFTLANDTFFFPNVGFRCCR
jgi:hypothetical protein